LWLYHREADTIDYVATNATGNTSTSTRTVIVVAPASVPN